MLEWTRDQGTFHNFIIIIVIHTRFYHSDFCFKLPIYDSSWIVEFFDKQSLPVTETKKKHF